jgi:nucleotide-binding universal stress UspA family protein
MLTRRCPGSHGCRRVDERRGIPIYEDEDNDAMNGASDENLGPALLGYDGSDAARGAIASAGRVLSGREAVVVTVWESVGSAILRNLPAGATALGRDARGIAEDVVEELDAAAAEGAEAMAAEGAGLATRAGFVARPVARRALARAAERNAVTVWRAILDAADEEAAELIVLGSRGRSAVTSMVLGSVSYGVVNNSDRPVLIIPPDPG